MIANSVVPFVITIHGHVKGTKELARPVDGLAQIDNTPTVIFIGHIGIDLVTVTTTGGFTDTIVRTVSRRKENVTYLRGRHIVAKALRSSVRRATRHLQEGFARLVIHSGVPSIGRRRYTPPLGDTGMVMTTRAVVRIILRIHVTVDDVRTVFGIALNGTGSNPIVFCFRVIERIDSAIVRVLEATIAVGEDLNQVILHCNFPSSIHEVLATVSLGIFFKEEVFRDRIRRIVVGAFIIGPRQSDGSYQRCERSYPKSY